MAHDILSSFVEDMCSCLHLKNELVKYRQVHNEKVCRGGDLSFPAGFIPNRSNENGKSPKHSNFPSSDSCSCLTRNVSSDSADGCEAEKCMFKELRQLRAMSAAWKLRIDNYDIKMNHVVIYLQKEYAFKTALKNVLEKNHDYGSHGQRHRGIFIEACVSERDHMDLSQLRLQYLKASTEKIARLSGYHMIENRQTSNDIGLFLATGPTGDKPDGMKAIVCGAVVNAKTRTKETDMLARDYLRLRINDMKTVALHKYGDAVDSNIKWNNLISALGEATVKMELLKVKPGQTVSLNLESEYRASRELSSKGATFVLYNHARISSILKQFQEKVDKMLYPALIAVDEIDFTLLKSDEEWELLHFILTYPSVVNQSIRGVEKGVLKPYIICIFLSAVCKTFSVYYRRTRILREARQHLVPVMFARIYLLKALQIILQSSLSLLDIDTVNQM